MIAYQSERFIALSLCITFVLVLSPILGFDIAASHRLLLGLPFFLIGMILQRQSQRLATKKRFNQFLLAFCVLVICILPKQLIQVSGSTWGTMTNLALVVIVLLPLSQLHLGYRTARWSTALGERSFALYASHFPVILISRHFLADPLRENPILYVFAIVCTVAVGTEIVFRFVEIPAIKWSRRIKNVG